jgi:hypothetical protein
MATSHSTAYRLPIKDFPGYAVSRDGKVWSCRKKGYGGGFTDSWRELKPDDLARGHLNVALVLNGKRHRRMVHRLVLETFHSPCPDGMEACHNDGVPTNNHIDNLRWDTHSGNLADRIKHGTMTRGENNKGSKLTEEQVRRIRRDRKSGWSLNRLAERENIGITTVCAVTTGQNWGWLEDE